VTEDCYERVDRVVKASLAELPWAQKGHQRAAKRAFDIVFASLLLLLVWPIILLTGILVRLTSHGPALFVQTRLRRGGAPFQMYKFRTMTHTLGTDHELKEVIACDPRLTSIGGILRATRLDELPQLVHVLRGEMSLVGPRPDVPQNLPRYRDEQLVRFAVPQGCTTWSMVSGGFRNDWSTRQDLEVEYAWRWSFLLDLKIIVRTALVLLTQRGTIPDTAEKKEGAANL
jgi:lipopolysaccharide/colanic/teichoic acid biosynthesis glycosyltransferase